MIDVPVMTYQSRIPQDTTHSPPKVNAQVLTTSLCYPLVLVHPLPSNPVIFSVPFVYPSYPSIIEATAMASRANHDKRNGAGSNTDYNDSLPPGWVIKYPRNNCSAYYHSIPKSLLSLVLPHFPPMKSAQNTQILVMTLLVQIPDPTCMSSRNQ